MSRFTGVLETIVQVVLVIGFLAPAVDPFRDLAVVPLPLWISAVGVVGVGALIALLQVDLKRAFLRALLVGVLASLAYIAAVWSPATTLPEHSTRLLNFGLVQSVLIGMLALFLLAVGALLGTVINSSVRGIEL